MVVVGVAGGATGGDSDGVAEAVHNGEASDIMDEKDSKRGLWKSVKDLRRMLRLVVVRKWRNLVSLCPQETISRFPCIPLAASHSQNRPSFLLSNTLRILRAIFSVGDEERTGNSALS